MSDFIPVDTSNMTEEERQELERIKMEKIKFFVEWNARIALRRLKMELEKEAQAKHQAKHTRTS